MKKIDKKGALASKDGKDAIVPFSSPLTASYALKSSLTVDNGASLETAKHKSSSKTCSNRFKKGRGGKRNSLAKQQNAKRKEKRLRLDAEEEHLTGLLFGNGNELESAGGAAWNGDDDYTNSNRDKEEDDYFRIDRVGSDDEKDAKAAKAVKKQTDSSSVVDSDPAAWIDEDDANLTISLLSSSDRTKKLRTNLSEDVVHGQDYEARLRDRYQTTVGTMVRTDWATVPSNHSGQRTEEDNEDEYEPTAVELLSSTTPLLATQGDILPPHTVNIVRCRDANQREISKSAVQAVQFCPDGGENAPLLLTAGLDKTLRFFKVDGERNEKIHGIHFPDLPVYSASFLGTTGNVVVTGRRRFFYIYDYVSGKIDKVPSIQGREERSLEKFATSPDGSLIAFIGIDGYVILVETKSKMWVADLKMNGSARAVVFSPCGTFLTASGSDGDVYRWDLRNKRCVDRFQNEDGTITSMLSSSLLFLAVGAESGVVNLYDDCVPVAFERRSPVKTIMNLHTTVDCLKFNHDGQILAMSTRREKDCLKLFHVPSKTVFSNWPTSKTPLGYVWSLDFSPNSKYLALGNDKGKCLLYELKHYSN